MQLPGPNPSLRSFNLTSGVPMLEDIRSPCVSWSDGFSPAMELIVTPVQARDLALPLTKRRREGSWASSFGNMQNAELQDNSGQGGVCLEKNK